MNKVVQQYDLNKDKYENALHLVEQLVVSLMKANHINYHSIAGRLKTRKSLEGKLIEKAGKYGDITEITDIIGLRIITYTEDLIDQVRDLIGSEFTIDVENSVDKRQKEPNEFGYSSLHLIVALSKERLELTEYRELSDLRVEIQIRTILQHAWAEIEHDIGYKSTTGIPAQLKRSFSRIASLLELADIEFVKILDETVKYEDEVDHNLMNASCLLDMDIDVITLNSFIKNSVLIRELDHEIAEILNYTVIEEEITNDVSSLIEKLEYFSIDKITALDQLMQENSERISKIANAFKREDGKEKTLVSAGISIFYLFYALLSVDNSYVEIKKYLADFSIGFNWEQEAFAFQEIFKSV